jgi:hypothetical protein
MSEEKQVEKPNDRIELLQEMLRDARLPENPERTRIWSDFGKEAIVRLSEGAPNVGFWQKMGAVRKDNPAIFDEVVGVGFDYARHILAEWLSMENPSIQKVLPIQEGPTDGSCSS